MTFASEKERNITMKKLTSIILAALLAAASMTACSNNTPESDKSPSTDMTENPPEEVTVDETEELTATDIVKQKYSENNLDGITFATLAPDKSSHWIYCGMFNEVYAEELNGEVVNDSLFQRNSLAEELLNIHLVFDLQNSIGNVTSIISKNVTAGDASYDLSLATMTSQADLMMKGQLLNARSISTLDLTQPWWDKNEVDTFTLYDKLYWLCGDINIGDDNATQVMYFNKNMLNAYSLESPYGPIMEGTWTLDRLYQMAVLVKSDTDGDGQMTLNDTWGLVDANGHITHYLYSTGETMIDKSDDGSLRLKCFDESQVTAVETLYRYFVDYGLVYIGNVNNDVTSFTGDHTLFYSNQLYTLNLLREMESDFGIIPLPKLTEDQENYGTFLSHGGATAFAIPMTNDKIDSTGIILDVLCGLSTDTLHSAFYDVLFASKLVRDPESVASLDAVFASKVYDWGVDFSWASSIGNVYSNMVVNQNPEFISALKKNEKIANKQLEKLNKTISELP